MVFWKKGKVKMLIEHTFFHLFKFCLSNKLRYNLLKDMLKENCNTGGTVITELEWGFHGLRTGVSSAVGQTALKGPHSCTSAWWAQLAMRMGHQVMKLLVN